MLSNKKILVADDEPHLVHIVAYTLKKAGATVETAKNGLECLEKAASFQPDLIVSDYQMPLLDGLQAAVRLAADPRTAHIPVLLLTARGHRISAAELTDACIRTVLPKPFSARELVATINGILSMPATEVDAA